MLPNKEKRVGIDLHGTIDSNVSFFRKVMDTLLKEGWEVYIITGMEKQQVLKEMKPYDLSYTDILSVIDYHKSIGTTIHYDEDGNPWIDEKLWNETKAEMCLGLGVYVHIDDSKEYGKFFNDSTIYFQYTGNELSENYVMSMIELIIHIFKVKGKDR